MNWSWINSIFWYLLRRQRWKRNLWLSPEFWFLAICSANGIEYTTNSVPSQRHLSSLPPHKRITGAALDFGSSWSAHGVIIAPAEAVMVSKKWTFCWMKPWQNSVCAPLGWGWERLISIGNLWNSRKGSLLESKPYNRCRVDRSCKKDKENHQLSSSLLFLSLLT